MPKHHDGYETREEWLQAAIALLAPMVDYETQKQGLMTPERIHVSVGFPSTGRGGKRIGECWAKTASADESPHVFIHPSLSDGVRVLGVLIHEMIHAVGIMGHKSDFRRPAVALGLTGKMTATEESDELKSTLQTMIDDDLGEYPHARLDASKSSIKKQTTRMVKLECMADDGDAAGCGMIIRTTRKWLEEIGEPACACGGRFEQ